MGSKALSRSFPEVLMAKASWTARWITDPRSSAKGGLRSNPCRAAHVPRSVCKRGLSGIYRNLQGIICAYMKSAQIRPAEWENNYEIHAGRADSERSVVAPFEGGGEATRVFDLGLVLGSPEVGAMPSAAPPRPARANRRVGHLPKSRIRHPEASTAALRSDGKAGHF